MNEQLQREAERLARSWMQHEQTMLRDYLVAGVEDPRINLQSVLTRHFIIVALFGSKFTGLQEHELRFALVMNWLRTLFRKQTVPEDFDAICHALATGADHVEGIAIPAYIRSANAALPAMVDQISIPNYLQEALHGDVLDQPDSMLNDQVLGRFEQTWNRVLAREKCPRFRFLEPACGSANDYRFLSRFGLARLLDYTGFDLCEKNVRNAKDMFPETPFSVGNVFEIDAQEQAFDYCIVHDLFEHLSLEGLDQAFAEINRVTRQGLCLGFFNLHEGPDHFVRPSDEYHWNTLSVPRLKARLERDGFEVRVVHIDTLLKWRFGCADTHNRNAYTFFATRGTASMRLPYSGVSS